MKFRKYTSWMLLLGAVSVAQAHGKVHLDDTPQDTYNPTTTLFTTQAAIQHNLGIYRAVADDISIGQLHRFTWVQQHGNQLQNLGNNGTATRPIFYKVPDTIGSTSGFHVYDTYFRSPDQFRYYNTLSPYTKLYVVLARLGSFYADICHSRNIIPNWNIGMNFRNMMTDKEWILIRKGDRNVVSYGVDFFTHYKTDHERYQLLAHLLVAKHRVRETGGITTPKYLKAPQNVTDTRHTTKEKIWNSSNMANSLTAPLGGIQKNPESIDARKRFHLYQQWAMKELLWIYHGLTVQEQHNTFKADALSKQAQLFLGELQKNRAQAHKAVESTAALWGIKNELGIKGDWKDWFCSSYYRHEKIYIQVQKTAASRALHEHYVGLHARYGLANSTTRIHMKGEYLFPDFYKVYAAYEGVFFRLSCNHIKHKPSLLAERAHFYQREWNRQFTPPKALQVSGELKITSKVVQIRPYVSLVSIYDRIYFDLPEEYRKSTAHVARPRQSSKRTDVVTVGADVDFALGKHMRWDSELTAARTWSDDVNVPNFLINTRLYYTDTTTAGNGTFEAGIDVHWKASYKADGYDPVTQQFYLQNDFMVYSYPIIDLFLNFRIKHFSAFLKFSHCNEFWLAPAPGYFTTPLYPGQRKALDIGFSWSFFD